MRIIALLYLYAFFGAAIGSSIFMPFWIRWCIQKNWVDDPGHRKIHHVPIPLAGGLGVFCGMALVLAPTVAGGFLSEVAGRSFDPLEYGLEKRGFQLLAVVLGGMGMLLLGWLDDLRELSPARKFLGQLVIAVGVAAAGIRITLFIPSLAFSYGITVLWILAITNAFNFTDNMNGLCGGLGLIAAVWFAVLSASHDQFLVAAMALTVTGALCGFLPYNFPKAAAFLGDAGSHWVGYWMAILAILPHYYSSRHNANPMAVLSPALILAVPLLDLASVVWIRTRSGIPFWIGDNNHFSHRLVRGGMSRAKAVICLWLISIGMGSLAWFLQ